MEMVDITAGLPGFLASFAAFAVARGIYHLTVNHVFRK